MLFQQHRTNKLAHAFDAYQQRQADAPSQEQLEALIRKFIRRQGSATYSLDEVESAIGALARLGHNPFADFVRVDDIVENAQIFERPRNELNDPALYRAYRERKNREEEHRRGTEIAIAAGAVVPQAVSRPEKVVRLDDYRSA